MKRDYERLTMLACDGGVAADVNTAVSQQPMRTGRWDGYFGRVVMADANPRVPRCPLFWEGGWEALSGQKAVKRDRLAVNLVDEAGCLCRE